MRRQAYWAYLAGGYYINGHLTIWGFGTTGDWKSSINAASAGDMGLAKDFFKARSWWKFIPDQSVFASGAGSGSTLNAAARSSDGDSIIVYLSCQTTVGINMTKITAASNVDAQGSILQRGHTVQ